MQCSTKMISVIILSTLLMMLAYTNANEHSTIVLDRLHLNLSKESNNLICQETSYPIGATLLKNLITLYETANRSCPYPLMATNHDDQYIFPNIPCGLVCDTPSITEQELIVLRIFAGVLGMLIWLFSILTLITIMLNFPLLNRFITRPAIYLVLCNFAVFSLFIVQLFGLSSNVACNEDGSLAINQPSKHFGCSISFSIIYYFNMASVCWILCLCHACFIKAKNIKETYSKSLRRWEIMYEITYHIISWLLPLVLLIAILALRVIAGDYTLGMCYLQTSQTMFYFQSLPTLLLISLSLPMLIYTFIRLYTIHMYLKQMMKQAQRTKNCCELRNFLIKALVFIIIAIIHLSIISLYGISEFNATDIYLSRLIVRSCCKWLEMIGQTNACTVQIEDLYSDPVTSRIVAYLFILSLFFQHMLLTLWIWRWDFICHWFVFFRDPCGKNRGGFIFRQQISSASNSNNSSHGNACVQNGKDVKNVIVIEKITATGNEPGVQV